MVFVSKGLRSRAARRLGEFEAILKHSVVIVLFDDSENFEFKIAFSTRL